MTLKLAPMSRRDHPFPPTHPLLFLLVLVGVTVARLDSTRMPQADAALRKESSARPGGARDYDPLRRAREKGEGVENLEATVPPMCYTRTQGQSNPCWTCHVDPLPNAANPYADASLQETYSFSDYARVNHWTNLFQAVAPGETPIRDEAAELAWIRQDNYTPLRQALANRTDYPGFKPDLALAQGFDAEGFARDGTDWRAVRYKPFPGTFWPTNGSTDDVMIRLPRAFRQDAQGRASREIYRLNLAILEASLAGNPLHSASELQRSIEPVDETVGKIDLDGDGKLTRGVTRIRGLPEHYVGGAAGTPVERFVYPSGVEFLHSVRYLDPDQPTLMSQRMKELRYARKVQALDPWGRLRAIEKESDEKEEGRLPRFAGSAFVGLRNALGWQLQGFIEDEQGRLRLQTNEEHRACMGCHGMLGVTVDQTFAFARKVPGADGWRPQDLRGMPDAPQVGHALPEVQTYFLRVQGGDEFRANDELRRRFFPKGKLDLGSAGGTTPGGSRDLAWLLTPSRERALALNRAYRRLVGAQHFEGGRDAVLSPPARVLRRVNEETTGLREAGRVYRDGRLWLAWNE